MDYLTENHIGRCKKNALLLCTIISFAMTINACKTFHSKNSYLFDHPIHKYLYTYINIKNIYADHLKIILESTCKNMPLILKMTLKN